MALLTLAAVALTGGVVSAQTSVAASAADERPCDIYEAGGTPCIAAHSTTRALFADFDGPMYQLTRTSDGATLDIHPVAKGGVADSAKQDEFCAPSTCEISVIYDQSGHDNELTRGWGFWAGPRPDKTNNLAIANRAVTSVNGQRVYGIFISPGTGYRKTVGNETAIGDEPQGIYGVLDGSHYRDDCCFDYGNTEPSGLDTGNGHMETLYFGPGGGWGRGEGPGPWIMADLENGIFSGVEPGYNSTNPTINHRYLTGIMKGKPGHWALRGGDATTGSLQSLYDGKRPNKPGYDPMSKEGAIVLGSGGDNSTAGAGTFYEGAITKGYPSDATEDLVQANITAAGYGEYEGDDAFTVGTTVRIASGENVLTRTTDEQRAKFLPLGATEAALAESEWKVRVGLADPSCISLESAAAPNVYLRHYGFNLFANTNTGNIAGDATFCPQMGNNPDGLSLTSWNYPERHIRDFNGVGYIGSDGGTGAWFPQEPRWQPEVFAWDTTTGWEDETTFDVTLVSDVTPTPTPTAEPTVEPTATPTAEPTAEPTATPTAEPTAEPTATPTAEPTASPTAEPTATPTVAPTTQPTVAPTTEPTVAPTTQPTASPTASAAATTVPTKQPTAAPTAAASAASGKSWLAATGSEAPLGAGLLAAGLLVAGAVTWVIRRPRRES